MQYEEKEMYLFLNFGDALERDYFNSKKLYFNISSLQDEHPFVQLDDDLFVGTYEDCIGTNVFFEELEEPLVNRNIFEKETPIHLKFVTKQWKELKLKHAIKKPINKETLYETNTVSEPAAEVAECETVSNEDEIIDSTPIIEDKVNTELAKQEEVEEPIPEVPIEEKTRVHSNKKKKKLLKLKISQEKYCRLKLLAKEPVRFVLPEEKVEIPEDLLLNYFYKWFSNNFIQIPVNFPELIHNFDTETLEGGIDVNKSIESGIICLDYWPRVLTESEKRILKDLDNFKNMSLPMRHLVITETIENLESGKERETKYGLSVEQYIQILKKVQYDVLERIKTLENEK